MIIDMNGKLIGINLQSAFLNLIGFVALVASWSDGTLAIIVALLIFIYDAILFPYPVISAIEDEEEPPVDQT